jgi:hypothetical protein
MTTPVGSTTPAAKGGTVSDDGIGSARDRSRLVGATKKVSSIGSSGRAGQVLNKLMTLDSLVTIGRTVIKLAPK